MKKKVKNSPLRSLSDNVSVKAFQPLEFTSYNIHQTSYNGSLTDQIQAVSIHDAHGLLYAFTAHNSLGLNVVHVFCLISQNDVFIR